MKGDVLESARTRPACGSSAGDEVEAIRYVDPTTGEILQSMEAVNIYPAKHFVTPKDRLDSAISAIRSELRERLDVLSSEASCWKPSGWSNAQSTTWRCWARWAIATAWRTTPAIWPAVRRARRRSA